VGIKEPIADRFTIYPNPAASDLSSGTYIVRIANDAESVIKKFIKL
jgi:hypothetical protein